MADRSIRDRVVGLTEAQAVAALALAMDEMSADQVAAVDRVTEELAGIKRLLTTVALSFTGALIAALVNVISR